MTGRSPKHLPRWASALALAALLLAAQQLALLHPLSHLSRAAPNRAHAHDEAPASDVAEVVCSLCVVSATVTQLATAAAVTVQALPGSTPLARDVVLARPWARAPSNGHNRGPPTGA